MKKIIISLACVLVGFASFGQTADDIINKYLDAIGGREKLQALKNTYMEGSVDAQGQKIVIKQWVEYKKDFRSEFTFGGMTGYSIITSDSGWNFSPFGGQKNAEPMTSDMVKRAQFELDACPLMNYKDKGYKVSYKGKDDVDGSDAFKLELVINDSNMMTLYFDPSTYYMMRMKTKEIVNGQTKEGTVDFSDYQKTPEGYVFPMTVGAEQGAVKFSVIKVNTDMDPSLFKPKR